jgi:lysozyme
VAVKLSQVGLDAIKRHEGLRLHAYLDSAGVPTIGWGHTQGVSLGQHISVETAEVYLRADLSWAESCVNNAITAPMTQGQYDAMVSLCFNIGEGAFKQSTLIREFNAGNVSEAADEFLRWDKATVNGAKVVLPGLSTRRASERAMFLAGIDTSLQPVEQQPETVHIAPRPDQEPHEGAPTMVAPAVAVAGSFLWELAKGAIAAFTPLAAEKLTKEMNRHTDKPEIAGQIVSGVIEAVKTATKKSDPLEAVVAFKAAPELVPQVEADALANLDKLMPVLDKMQQWEQTAWAAEEASRTAADERARSAEKDQDEFLTKAIVGMVIGLLLLVLVLIPILVWLKADAGTVGTLVGLFAGAGAAIIQSLNTRIQHRYGSSRGSAAKDVLAAELARRPQA